MAGSLSSSLMDPAQVCVWNIAFMSSNTRSWWHMFSPAWCRHVAAFGYVPASDCWIVIDPAAQRTVVYGIPDVEFTAFIEELQARCAVIVRIKARNAAAGAHRFGNWCSTTVARLTGVSGGAWRPLALYRSLLRNGATRVFGSKIDVVQGQRSQGRSRDKAPT